MGRTACAHGMRPVAGARDALEAARRSSSPRPSAMTRGSPRRAVRAHLCRVPRVGSGPRDREGARVGRPRDGDPSRASSAAPRSWCSTPLADRDHRRRRLGRRRARARRSRPTSGSAPPIALPDGTRHPGRRRGGHGRRRLRSEGAARAGVHRRGRRVPDRARAQVPRARAPGAIRSTSYRAMRVINPVAVHVLPRSAAGARASERARRSPARAPRRWCASRTA